MAQPNLHRNIILNGLQELSNARASGRVCGVTFDANNNEHWLQCTPSHITMDWPFASPPAENENFKACFGGDLQISEWEADSHVTFLPRCGDVEALIEAIDRTFQELYGLGPDFALRYYLHDTGLRLWPVDKSTQP